MTVDQRVMTVDQVEALAPGDDPATGSLLVELLHAGLLCPTGVDGLYGRSATYQRVADAVSRLVHEWGNELGAARIAFPPVLARRTFAETNYLESFPDLMGSVHVFRGGDREHRELLGRVASGGDWQALLEPAEVVLGSAACHAVYPLCRGRVPADGRFFDVSSFCFRHEPSTEPTRMQAFVMHEIVFVGSAAGAQQHRDEGLARGLALLGLLGLDVSPVPASDPFFGRVGSVLASGQLDDELKIEGVTDVRGNLTPTAIMSANCHRDHFGGPFAIETADGEVAHSACVAFGVDRIVVALLARHGLDPASWPADVRSRLDQ
ncbi:MAG TPA: amino acid--[acyl-carrier-protein] ligase [Acidimicrobiales bacterium]|nr:amino acid--[acyl-carrier-protein] ligase [Acidimicrobiales bacterium]